MPNGDSENEAGKGIIPPYLPFGTFGNTISTFKEHGLPSRIDKTVFPTMAGGNRPLIIQAFRFFSLIDSAGVPTDSLKMLVDADDQKRKEYYGGLLKCYGPLGALNLATSTPAQLDEEMKKLGAEGETARKALAFFLKLASEGGVTLGKFLQHKTRSAYAPRKKRTGNQSTAVDEVPDEHQNGVDEPIPQAALFTLEFSNGDTVSLNGNINFFTLSQKDREFLMGLVATLQAYGSESSKS